MKISELVEELSGALYVQGVRVAEAINVECCFGGEGQITE